MIHLHFLIESDLRVKRGEWTIAQARYIRSGFTNTTPGLKEINEFVEEWATRIEHGGQELYR